MALFISGGEIFVIMLIVVTTVSTLVHLYSTEYMAGDPHVPRFMAYLSLFTFTMLMLVTSSNSIILFRLHMMDSTRQLFLQTWTQLDSLRRRSTQVLYDRPCSWRTFAIVIWFEPDKIIK